VIGNAAKAEVKGVEMEFLALPDPNLQLAAGYAYLDAKFSEFTEGATTDNTGNTLPMAPEHKVNLSAQYDVALSEAGTLSVRVDWTRQSKTFLEASNTTEIQGPTPCGTRESRLGPWTNGGRLPRGARTWVMSCTGSIRSHSRHSAKNCVVAASTYLRRDSDRDDVGEAAQVS